MIWRVCSVRDFSEEALCGVYEKMSPARKERVDRQKQDAKKRETLAAEYLLQYDSSVSEIATMVGFHDSLYFSKMFHKMYQVSPREYRKQNKM